MRAIIGAILGIAAASLFLTVVYSMLDTEPCSLVPALQCHVLMGQQYASPQDFASSSPAIIALIASTIFGAIFGRMSG